jgi:hypothetical protein
MIRQPFQQGAHPVIIQPLRFDAKHVRHPVFSSPSAQMVQRHRLKRDPIGDNDLRQIPIGRLDHGLRLERLIHDRCKAQALQNAFHQVGRAYHNCVVFSTTLDWHIPPPGWIVYQSSKSTNPCRRGAENR